MENKADEPNNEQDYEDWGNISLKEKELALVDAQCHKDMESFDPLFDGEEK